MFCSPARQGHLPYNDGTDYDRILTEDDPLYAARPDAFLDAENDGELGVTPFAFPAGAFETDARVAYESAEYPWCDDDDDDDARAHSRSETA